MPKSPHAQIIDPFSEKSGGFDYGNLKGYDIVLNTNDKEPETVFQEILEKLEKSDFRTN